MRSIKNRLLLKGRKNKKIIITILLAVIVVSGRAQTSFDTGDGCLNVSLRNFSHKNLVSFVSIL